MIVSPQEYMSMQAQLTDPNSFSGYYKIPDDEPVYHIDLATRKSEAPPFIGVASDHDAEVIWFKTDRFYENIDLADSSILIRYTNALKKSYVTLSQPKVIAEDNAEKILFPWPISYNVAEKAGTITFAFQFYQTYYAETEESENEAKFSFILNTQPATSKILSGMTEKDFENSTWETLDVDTIRQFLDTYQKLQSDYELYWIEVK